MELHYLLPKNAALHPEEERPQLYSMVGAWNLFLDVVFKELFSASYNTWSILYHVPEHGSCCRVAQEACIHQEFWVCAFPTIMLFDTCSCSSNVLLLHRIKRFWKCLYSHYRATDILTSCLWIFSVNSCKEYEFFTYTLLFSVPHKQ